MAHDAFISYSSKDKTIADAVCARLEARGIRCWIAPRDVRPGAPYGEEIIDGIHEARVMVLVLSANANASPHIPKEVERAVSRGVPVIPLRVEDVVPAKSLDYFISSVHWLDAITPPLESHLENLAATIRTLLPDGSQKVIPPGPVPTPIPVPVPVPIPAPVPIPVRRPIPTWLWIVIGAAVLLVAGTAWYLVQRPEESVRTVPVIVQPPPNSTPSPSHPQPARPVPGFTPAASVPSSLDPILGCWHWMNNATVVINANGTMTAGPFTARWRLANTRRRVYNFSWPEAVDSVTLSPDGNQLSGGNQYGIPMTATRIAPGPEIAGSWRWWNGVIVNIQPNGTFSAVTTHGRWQSTGPSTYSLTWPGPVDTVTMSPDSGRVSGTNQYGFQISGTKMAACGG